MTQEEKQLLLQDLCTRLPYGVILQVGIFDNGDIKYHNKKLDYQLLSLIELDGRYYSNGLLCKYNQFTAKPYLRTMSSMTEEEEREYNAALTPLGDFMFEQEELFKPIQLYKNIPFELYEFFNSYHFDYRGLIPMGLALEAPNEIYNN